jgi:cytochrome c oxidase subunit 2
METTLRITPTELGDYKVLCAEICGFDHSRMIAPVRVVSQAEFEDWAANFGGSLASLSQEDRGGKWAVDYGCNACHSNDGSEMVGPTWEGLFGTEELLDDGTTVTVDDAYLRESILNPNVHIVAGYNPGVMPADFEEKFTTTENEIEQNDGIEVNIVDDLIAYIMTLSVDETE